MNGTVAKCMHGFVGGNLTKLILSLSDVSLCFFCGEFDRKPIFSSATSLSAGLYGNALPQSVANFVAEVKGGTFVSVLLNKISPALNWFFQIQFAAESIFFVLRRFLMLQAQLPHIFNQVVLTHKP